MHTRWFLIVLALIGAGLACSPQDPFGRYMPRRSYVYSVAVTPASGSGSFTLEVDTYSSYWGSQIVEPIYCYYVTPGGATMGIGSFDPPIDRPRLDTLTFNVSEPGDYTATCETEDSSSKKSAQFTVSDYPRTIEATGTPTSTATATQTKSPVFTMNGTFSWTHTQSDSGFLSRTSGLIKITVDSITGQASGFLSGGGYWSVPRVMDGDSCVPSLTIFTGERTYDASLTGTVDPKTGALSLSGAGTLTDQGDTGTIYCATGVVDKPGPKVTVAMSVSLDGVVDVSNRTGKGRLFYTGCPPSNIDCTQGDWDAGE